MASYLDKETLLSLGHIDPELQAYLERTKPSPINYDDLSGFKAVVEKRNAATMAAASHPPPGIRQTELQYPTRDGLKIRAKLYQPILPPEGGSPLIVIYHGGGFCVGTPESEEQTCQNFVRAFGAVCISATYRLAPEWKFPTAHKDAWDCLRWAAENAETWNANPSVGFVIGGTSAGANITAVLAHLARDEGLSPRLTGQYLAAGSYLSDKNVPEKYRDCYLSHEQNKDVPVLPRAARDMFKKGYEPDENDGVWYAVFNHPKGHSDVPPAFFQIDGLDPLRDEGIIFERVLREEYGIETKMNIYPGLPHGHWGFYPFLKASEEFRKDQIEGMAFLLRREPDFSQVVTKAAVAGV
ncbi:AB hydrolase superfamily protein B1A11.02 [Cercospora zeina]